MSRYNNMLAAKYPWNGKVDEKKINKMVEEAKIAHEKKKIENEKRRNQ